MQKFTRMCEKHKTIFDGFRVPVGAVYGRNKDARFVCLNFDKSRGYLEIFEKKGTRWIKAKAYKNHWAYDEIVNLIQTLGYIPKVGTFYVPRRENIPDRPNLRKVSYNYMRTGHGIGSLIGQSYDNADVGGSSVIHYPEAYDIYMCDNMDRRYVKNPLEK